MSTDLPSVTDSPQPVLHTYAPGSVVQVAEGDARFPGADVVSLHPATIQIAADRLDALVGNDETWTWTFDEIAEVQHGVDGTWTILPTPAGPSHGVALRPADVVAFRREFDNALGEHRNRQLQERFNDEETENSAASPPATDTIDAPTESGIPRVVHQRFDGWSGGSLGLHEADPDDVTQDDATTTVHAETVPTAPARETAPFDTSDLATLEARSISAWFGTHNVLDRVSLTMSAGRVTALIGPSGCGKSTFLRILNRMHEMIPSASMAGEVLLDGGDIYDVSKKLTDARRQIGMVFQKPNPFPAMSIYDNVVAGFRLTGSKISASEKDDVVESCLAKAGLWNEVRDRLRSPGGGLSGGQQQRLCIARSLAIRPRVLLMDEPCSALDPTSTRRIEQTIVELKSEVTIVIVTHNMQQANRVSDQCAFFLAEAGTPGTIVEYGDTEAMFHNPQDERTHAYVNGRFG